MTKMCEYNLYIPLEYPNGWPVAERKLTEIRNTLIARFGGLTVLAKAKGYHVDNQAAMKSNIAVFRVITPDTNGTNWFFRSFRRSLRDTLKQSEILVTRRSIEVLEDCPGASGVVSKAADPSGAYKQEN